MEIGIVGIVTAFAGGLISFLSPCVLPLAPPYLAYLGGTTLDKLAPANSAARGSIGAAVVEQPVLDRDVRNRVVLSACFFVLGLGTVFVLLGLTASVLGQTLLRYKIELATVSGIAIAVMGLHFLGVIRIPFLGREARFEGPAEAGSYGTSYVIGVAFAFGWTPCIGPVLSSILLLSSQQDTIIEGTLLLAVYAAGLGLPFILAAVFIEPFLHWARRFRRHMGTVEKAMGLLLLVVGAMIATGEFERLAFWLLDTFPFLGYLG
ncbi:MAG: cytochrome c biogenesis CcdA family protein [Pseudomonadota bacterium]